MRSHRRSVWLLFLIAGVGFPQAIGDFFDALIVLVAVLALAAARTAAVSHPFLAVDRQGADHRGGRPEMNVGLTS